MRPKISIIIPTLNEEKGIVKTLKEINKLSLNKEVIVIDGLSTDKTVENAKKYGARVILEKRKGKGVAMKTGVEKSKGEIVCFLDGDSTYPPRYIPKMLELLNECDVVIGSRLLKKEGAEDSLSTFFYYRVFPFILKNYIQKFKTSEPISGMRVMRRGTWDRLNPKSKNFMIELEMEVEMAKNKMRVIEVAIPCIKREGYSKFIWDWKTMLNFRRYIKSNERYLQNLSIVKRIL